MVGKPTSKDKSRSEDKSKSKDKPKTKPQTKAQKKNEKKSAQPKISAGTKAPAFSLPRDGGGAVSLKDFAGRKLVLYFYPRADTPVVPRNRSTFPASNRTLRAPAQRSSAFPPIRCQRRMRSRPSMIFP